MAANEVPRFSFPRPDRLSFLCVLCTREMICRSTFLLYRQVEDDPCITASAAFSDLWSSAFSVTSSDVGVPNHTAMLQRITASFISV